MLTFVAVTGFLGAGKTTTLTAIARRLESQGRRVAIITNDQGDDLVDTQLARPAATEVGEVTGGCFCCRFDDLLDVVDTIVGAREVDTILAEAVGSCTDLQATVVRPMKLLHGDRFVVAPLVTVVDPHRYEEIRRSISLADTESDLAYLFGKQLTEADVIAVNKSDLLATEAGDRLRTELAARYPSRPVLAYSARTGDGLDAIITALNAAHSSAIELEVDYDRYAAAEARLAWLNANFTLDVPPGADTAAWAENVLRHLATTSTSHGWTVGHVKVSVTAGDAFSKASLTSADADPSVDARATLAEAATLATAFVNARVACEPDELDRAVAEAVAAAGLTATATKGSYAFKPGYPRPTHRIPATTGS